MALKLEIIEKTEKIVRIVRVNREIAKAWNQTRQPYDTMAFCGWFWITRARYDGHKLEAGPFPTYSAALRDAYYRFVLQTGVPKVADQTNGSRIKPTNETTAPGIKI